MSFYNRYTQARAMALGFDLGEIDGVIGPASRAAIAEATAFQRAKGKTFIHASGISRIHLHWTGGTYTPNKTDLEHYHFLIDGEGKLHEPHAHAKKLAHTKNANTGAIGISICAMQGAIERPFIAGKYPVKELQVLKMAEVAAMLARTYDIPVTPYSILMHSEVEDVLGIKQENKWDLNYLPQIGLVSPRAAGDFLRTLIKRRL